MHLQRRTRADYAPLIAVLMFVIVAFTALAVDFAFMSLVGRQARDAADAGAHAAVIELRESGDTDLARSAAIGIVGANYVAGDPGELDPWADVTFGRWDFATSTWHDDETTINAVKVRVRRTHDSPAGAVPLLVAPIIGQDWGEAATLGESIAAIRNREIIVVQDVTGSFKQEIDLAREADLVLLDYLYERGFPADKIGMVVFTGAAEEYTPLVTVQDNYGWIRDAWSRLDWCDKDDPPDGMENGNDHMMDCRAGGDGTNQGAGIELAVEMFAEHGSPDALKVIVLVSDGKAQCIPSTAACDGTRFANGSDMAIYASDHNIHIFSVSFNETYNATQSAFLESLVSGIGNFYETPDEEDLPDILDTIARAIPVAIVE